MNEQKIQDIVATVLAQLGEKDVSPAAVTKVVDAQVTQQSNNSNESLPDLGDKCFKKWNGIRDAADSKVIDDLMSQTDARVGTGRTGPRPRTTALLRFLADHSRSKDTVIKNVESSWLQERNLLEVQSCAADKDVYLTRPDLGRKLNDDAKMLIRDNCKKSPQVQVVLSDGLSLDAVTVNHDEILPPLINGLKNAGLDVGTPFFLRYGRVKAQDEIGMLLDAEVNLLLIGERPGLGQSESLSCYAIYKPTDKTVESDRTVISNIHAGGTPPVEAAAVIVDLVKTMLAQKASGINLKR
ncbi:ethanolamine ammonia-lyase subunit EutC [Photobacterium lutimaris]|uniref:Ethanolamine ammonia-lyase small subunit n=1 Tax=Photobacterium lutimaris TaxID=388278 RepID=A0A2T3J061_9GAMM|nr:ethanolamine ammonia-lyase subunit EutC [Photobacterium lutimaris]PSU34307.1 ethanolamine ammonia lyase small subunit [Photobacterium lutimaris]TDR75897.1 ethanolamine ammonia-lyase light chain [Photobacterium lutimaris]